MQLANTINHVVYVLDESESMYRFASSLVKVADNQTSYLGQRSKETDQETRVTVYTFNSRGSTKCVFFDKDVLRLPSIKDHYKPRGMTALVDAVLIAIEDLEKTAQMYGDHSFLIYVLTDGWENNSANHSSILKNKIDNLPDNWTVGTFVPDVNGVVEAKRMGFPAGNIAVWNPSDKGVAEFGETVKAATDTYMANRSMGIRSTKNLFSLTKLTPNDIRKNLVPLTPGSYVFKDVTEDIRVDEFILNWTGKPYKVGRCYYQLTKPEDIQGAKDVLVLLNNNVYSGPQVRKLLGLPDTTVHVNPKDNAYSDYAIFVQSTAYNRKLIKGTRLLTMR
jgi:hypothetical protein